MFGSSTRVSQRLAVQQRDRSPILLINHITRPTMSSVKRPVLTLAQSSTNQISKKRRKLLASALPHEEFHQPVMKKLLGKDWHMDDRFDIDMVPVSKGDIYEGKVEGICANGELD